MDKAPLMTEGPEAADRQTHIERINPGDNPAYIPGIALGPQPTTKKPYRVTRQAKHNDVILPPGTIVMLDEDEVADHHEALEAPPAACSRRAITKKSEPSEEC